MRRTNYHATIGIEQQASPSEIYQAYTLFRSYTKPILEERRRARSRQRTLVAEVGVAENGRSFRHSHEVQEPRQHPLNFPKTKTKEPTVSCRLFFLHFFSSDYSSRASPCCERSRPIFSSAAETRRPIVFSRTMAMMKVMSAHQPIVQPMPSS